MLALKGDLLGVYERLGSHGDLSYMQFLGHGVYLTRDPKDIFRVLVTDNRKFMKGRATHEAKRLLGEGLLTSNGELHRRQRKLLQPAFHPQRLERQGQFVVRCAMQLSDRWTDGETVDVGATMAHLALSVLGEAILDYDLQPYVRTFVEALDAAVAMVKQVLRPWGPTFEKLPLPLTRRFRVSRERLWAVCDEMIARRRAEPGQGDLLSLMLAKQTELGNEVLPDAQIRDELVTIVLTGYETMTQQLTWTCYLLGRHPEVMAALHAELDVVVGDASPTVAQLESLPFTEQVLLEAMRMFPPVYAMQRKALVDCELHGYQVPKGALVVCSQYLMHRSDRWFADPERFDPWRWTSSFRACLPDACYFPFGRGPRACIGEAFAMVESRLILSTLFRRWSVRSAAPRPVGVLPSISLRPDGPVRVVVERRAGRSTGP